MDRSIAALRTYCAIANPGTPSTLLVPSTRQVFDWIGKHFVDESCVVVGHAGVEGMVAPAVLLSRLQREGHSLPCRVVVFTDQLVAAQDATIPVLRHGIIRFLSPVEYILNHQFRCPLYAVNSGELAYIGEASPIHDVLKFTLAHLEAADSMGQEWLARDQQQTRSPESRRARRRKYIRAMQSTLLHMTGRHAPAPASFAADEKLDALCALYQRA